MGECHIGDQCEPGTLDQGGKAPDGAAPLGRGIAEGTPVVADGQEVAGAEDDESAGIRGKEDEGAEDSPEGCADGEEAGHGAEALGAFGVGGRAARGGRLVVEEGVHTLTSQGADLPKVQFSESGSFNRTSRDGGWGGGVLGTGEPAAPVSGSSMPPRSLP